MHRSLIGLVAAAGIGLGSFAEPAPAEAQCYGCAVGAGIIGGMAVGAIVGSAIANSPPPGYYGPPPGYYPPPPPPPGAYGPAYAQTAPGCWWGKRRVWVDGVGYRLRPVQVCP